MRPGADAIEMPLHEGPALEGAHRVPEFGRQEEFGGGEIGAVVGETHPELPRRLEGAFVIEVLEVAFLDGPLVPQGLQPDGHHVDDLDERPRPNGPERVALVQTQDVVVQAEQKQAARQ